MPDFEKRVALSTAHIAHMKAINTINEWLFRYPLSTSLRIGVSDIWKTFDKIKMDLLNLSLEADKEADGE